MEGPPPRIGSANRTAETVSEQSGIQYIPDNKLFLNHILVSETQYA